MKIYFKIKKKEYSTIDSDKLSIQQYLNILLIINEEEKNILDISKSLLYEITNIPNHYINELNEVDLIYIDWSLYISDLNNLNKIKHIYSGKNYEFKLKDLSELRFGNYIDLDYYLIQNNNNKIINVVSLMLLESNYKLKDFNSMKTYVEEMPLKDVISIYNYFVSFRTNIFKDYKTLFVQTDEEEEYTEEQIREIEREREKKKDEKVYSAWLEKAYMLTNKDITKNDIILEKPLIEVLNYLVWLKAENQKEIDNIRKNNRR